MKSIFLFPMSFVCAQCQRPFASQSDLRRHETARQRATATAHTCISDCNAGPFQSRCALDAHQLSCDVLSLSRQGFAKRPRVADHAAASTAAASGDDVVRCLTDADAALGDDGGWLDGDLADAGLNDDGGWLNEDNNDNDENDDGHRHANDDDSIVARIMDQASQSPEVASFSTGFEVHALFEQLATQWKLTERDRKDLLKFAHVARNAPSVPDSLFAVATGVATHHALL